MRRPPANHQGAMAGLVQDVPNGFRLSREHADGTHARTIRQRLAETVNAMFVSSFSGRDGRPEHRAEDRINGGEIAMHSICDETCQVWHLSRVEQRLNYLPVSRIPTDKEQAHEILKYER